MKYFEIDAFFPFYTQDGHDETCILLHDGTKEYITSNIKKYTSYLLVALGLDPKVVHSWSSKITGLKQNMPLIVDANTIFLPIKFRKRLNSTTTAFGYINQSAIATYSDMTVTLTNQTVLQTLSPAKFIDKKFLDAQLLSHAYAEYFQANSVLHS